MIDREDQTRSLLFSLQSGTLKIIESETDSSHRLVHKVGNIVDGKYKILKLIGEGGMGVVYVAHHTMLDKDVALKTFRSSDLSSEALIRFQREAQAIAKLNHQHIVQVFDFGQSQGGLPYYTMELLSGKTLADTLASEGALTVKAAVRLFSQACQGLAVAHGKGIVHRDLKPANICLEASQNRGAGATVKIVDFGIASLASSSSNQRLTTSGVIFGSPLYMSPEQATGQEVTSQSDIYSLGCTLYEALTGKPPFRGATAMETIMEHCGAVPPSLSEASGGKVFAQALEDLVSRMLAKNPADRPANVGAVEEALTKLFSADLKREARPSTSFEKTPVTAQQTRPAANLLLKIIVCAGVMCGCVAAYLQLQKPQKKRAPATTLSLTEATKSTKAARLIAARNKRKIIGGKEYFVIQTGEPELDLGTFANRLISDRPVAASGSFEWQTGCALTFLPSSDFWSDMTNFEAIPDNSLYKLDCFYAPKNADLAKLFECIRRQRQTLNSLNLGYIEPRKADFQIIEQIPHLDALSFADSNVDGAEVGKLHCLHKLRVLDFTGGKNARAAIQPLKNSLRLHQLWLNGTHMSGEDIETIATMKSLNVLDLSNNDQVTDADLKTLAKLPKLFELRVPGCTLTPAAIPILQTMKQNGLSKLFLTCTTWPEADVDKLNRLFPDGDFKKGFVNQQQSAAIPSFKELFEHSAAADEKK